MRLDETIGGGSPDTPAPSVVNCAIEPYRTPLSFLQFLPSLSRETVNKKFIHFFPTVNNNLLLKFTYSESYRGQFILHVTLNLNDFLVFTEAVLSMRI